MKRLMAASRTSVLVGKLVVASKVDEFAAAVSLLRVGPRVIMTGHHAGEIFGWVGDVNFLFLLRFSFHGFY